jgi:hypothetical protein
MAAISAPPDATLACVAAATNSTRPFCAGGTVV